MHVTRKDKRVVFPSTLQWLFSPVSLSGCGYQPLFFTDATISSDSTGSKLSALKPSFFSKVKCRRESAYCCHGGTESDLFISIICSFQLRWPLRMDITRCLFANKAGLMWSEQNQWKCKMLSLMLGSRGKRWWDGSHETKHIHFIIIGFLLSEVLRKVWHVCLELCSYLVFTHKRLGRLTSFIIKNEVTLVSLAIKLSTCKHMPFWGSFFLLVFIFQISITPHAVGESLGWPAIYKTLYQLNLSVNACIETFQTIKSIEGTDYPG